MDTKDPFERPVLPRPRQRVANGPMLAVSLACLLFSGGCIAKPHVIGLKPESPGLAACAVLGPCPFFAKRESPVEGLRPTFRWEQFPRTADLAELGPHAHERVMPVHYELRLWKVGPGFSGDFQRRSKSFLERPGASSWIGAADDYMYSWAHECWDSDPGKLVYSKQGLTTPEHQLETPLEPDSLYFWTVRAHFTLDGKRRATEWSEQLLLYQHDQVQTWPDGCSSPATFHLIRTP